MSTTPISTTPISTTPISTTPISATPISATPISTTPICASAIAPSVLEALLARLVVLFLAGAGGNPDAARHAAHQMLVSFLPETNAEARLAAKIISFDLHALEALSQATDPALPIARVLRLRSGAVSLSRESRKCQERLDQLQAARLAAEPVAEAATTITAADPDPAPPKIEQAITPLAKTGEGPAARKSHGLSWTKDFNKRLMAQKIAENLKKNQPPATVQPQAASLPA